MIKAHAIADAEPARYKHYTLQKVFGSSANVDDVFAGVWPYKTQGRLVNVIFSQSATGANGTYTTGDIEVGGTSMLATLPRIPVGAAANAKVDVLGHVTNDTTTGAVSPVLSATDANRLVSAGQIITFDFQVSGTYSSTYPTIEVTAVFDTQPWLP